MRVTVPTQRASRLRLPEQRRRRRLPRQGLGGWESSFFAPLCWGDALIDQQTVKNLLLGAMCSDDFAMLRPNLTKVHLARAQELVRPGEVIEHCWFLEDSIVSIVAISHDGKDTEAGIVGRDGMVDVATILGVDRSPNLSFVQIPGGGYRMRADCLLELLNTRASLRSLLNRHVHNLIAQISSTAHVNASFTVERRLARWLLMCSDRLNSQDIGLTHDLMSTMLNVRRAGVTQAISNLANAGFVASTRGLISIVNRPALIGLVQDCYTPVPDFDQ